MKEQFNKQARQIRYKQYLECERNKYFDTRYQYKQFIIEQNHSVFLTLKFDFNTLNKLTLDQMTRTLREFDSRLNRKLLGPKWSKKPKQNVQWDAFAEKIDSHGHWHLLAKVELNKIGRFAVVAQEAWQSLLGVDKSDNDFKADVIYNICGLAHYVTKEFKDTHVNSRNFKLWQN